MIDRAEIDKINRAFSGSGQKVLSLYLNEHAENFDAQKRKSPIELKNVLNSISHAVPENERPAFEKAAAAARSVIESSPGRKGRAIFAGADGVPVLAYTFNVPFPTEGLWEEEAFTLPLLTLLDEHERLGVILVDRNQARFFSIFCGEIEDKSSVLASESSQDTSRDVREYARVRSTARDQRKSSDQNLSHADSHAGWHLQHAAEVLERKERELGFERLIVGGPDRAAKAFEEALSPSLRERLAGRIKIAADAKTEAVLEKASVLEEQIERRQEKKMAESLILRAEKKDRAVTGIEAVEKAADEGRIHCLLYAGSFEASVDPLIPRVTETGGRIEELHGEAAGLLEKRGSIGAILRY